MGGWFIAHSPITAKKKNRLSSLAGRFLVGGGRQELKLPRIFWSYYEGSQLQATQLWVPRVLCGAVVCACCQEGGTPQNPPEPSLTAGGFPQQPVGGVLLHRRHPPGRGGRAGPVPRGPEGAPLVVGIRGFMAKGIGREEEGILWKELILKKWREGEPVSGGSAGTVGLLGLCLGFDTIVEATALFCFLCSKWS